MPWETLCSPHISQHVRVPRTCTCCRLLGAREGPLLSGGAGHEGGDGHACGDLAMGLAACCCFHLGGVCCSCCFHFGVGGDCCCSAACSCFAAGLACCCFSRGGGGDCCGSAACCSNAEALDVGRCSRPGRGGGDCCSSACGCHTAGAIAGDCAICRKCGCCSGCGSRRHAGIADGEVYSGLSSGASGRGEISMVT